jgi:hypothetical protein
MFFDHPREWYGNWLDKNGYTRDGDGLNHGDGKDSVSGADAPKGTSVAPFQYMSDNDPAKAARRNPPPPPPPPGFSNGCKLPEGAHKPNDYYPNPSVWWAVGPDGKPIFCVPTAPWDPRPPQWVSEEEARKIVNGK